MTTPAPEARSAISTEARSALELYLSDLLSRVKTGEVLAFIGSAVVLKPLPVDIASRQPNRVEVQVRVSPHMDADIAGRLALPAYEQAMTAVFDGAMKAGQMVAGQMEEHIRSREPTSRIVMP